MNCCDKLTREIEYTKHFSFNENGLHINFKECDYDQDYGHSRFTLQVKVDHCPFCGRKA